MARHLIDALTLLHVADTGLDIDPDHRLIAPNSIRSQALQLLLLDVRCGKRTDRAAPATHERITELKVRLLGDRVSRTLTRRIARDHDWPTLHDAEYLAITRLRAEALIQWRSGEHPPLPPTGRVARCRRRAWIPRPVRGCRGFSAVS